MKRSRKRSGITLVTAMVTAVAMLLPSQALRAGAEEAAASGPSAGCASPPSYATVGTESCDRFVQLWTPRVTNQQWLTNFIKAASVPADIQAEGYHGLDQPTQGWLIKSLVQKVEQDRGETLAPADLERTEGLIALSIFGKDSLNELKRKATTPSIAEADRQPAGPSALQPMEDALAATPMLRPPASTAPAPPATQATTNLLQNAASGVLNGLRQPKATSVAPVSPLKQPTTLAAPRAALDPNSLIALIIGVLGTPPLADLLGLITQLLGAVANIQQQLFAIPGLNLLGGLTYRVCAQSPTQPLACSVNLPIGVPIPVDVTGDHVVDVLATLAPVVQGSVIKITGLLPLTVKVLGSTDVGVSFEVRRLFPGQGPLPAHVFAVYDPPRTSKRVEYGYDARLSTLADISKSTVILKDVLAAIRGDIEVVASVTHQNPGSNEALTAVVKTLEPRPNQLPAEVDPMAAAVRFTPVPTNLVADLHMQHTALAPDRDTVTLDSDVLSKVTALVTQDVNSVGPPSHREFSALIDKMPQHVGVDVLHQDPKQIITYGASSAINHFHVNQKSVDNINQPGTFTQNDADVLSVPTDVKLTLQGAEDVVYAASAVVPQVQFATQTFASSVLQKEIVANVTQIPKNIHLNNATAPNKTTVTYDADSSLGSIGVGIFDRANDLTTINALAQSMPLHAQLEQTKSTGATDYTSSGPIGVIKATLTRNGGSTTPFPAADHLTFLKVGNAIGVDFQISGVVAAHADPSSNAKYGLVMSPGNQRFVALASLDAPNRLASVDISNLPSTIDVTIDPGNGRATYAASSVITSLDGQYSQPDIGQIAHIVLNSIPKNITATWATGGATPAITYEADSHLGSIDAFYQQATNQTAFSALISNLPLFMAINGVDPISFDARSSSTAPSASDQVGQILLRYASDGNLIGNGDSNDHLFLNAGPTTHAELLYSGLKFFSVNTANDEVHATVKNALPRLFDVQLVTPNMTANGFIDKVPDEVNVNIVGQDIHYTASSVINQIAIAVDELNGTLINASVTSIPNDIHLVLDSVNSTADWTASGTTGGLSVVAQLAPATTGSSRTFNASLIISSVPAVWNASYGAGHILFDGVSAPIGLIEAIFTNHGTATTLPGDGISAVFNQVSGDLDAFLQISALDRAEFQKVAPVGSGAGGFDANLDMGTGGFFGINADITLSDATKLLASGGFSNLPTHMHLRAVDGLTTYNGNSNPTLTLAVQYGKTAALAAVPPVPAPHGIAVRDGAGGGGKAIKANIWLTGLPTGLSFDTVSGIYTVTGFHPTVDPLTVDVALDDFVSTPASLLLKQTVGTSSPVNFTAGPFTAGTNNDGTKTIHAGYTASRGMGQLLADAVVGTNVAHLDISNIPSSLTIDTLFGENTKTITITLGEVVTSIQALYKRTSDGTFIAGATLGDVPKTVNLVIGEQDDNQGVTAPVFTYTGDTNGLDVSAFVSDQAFGPASHASVQLNVTNFGKVVTAGLNGKTLNLASTPATQSFTLVAAAIFDFGFNLDFDAGPIHNEGNVGINFNLSELTVGFTNMSSLNVHLGVSSGVDGNYGSFTFNEDSDTHLTFDDELSLRFSVFGFDIDIGLASIHVHNIDLGNVIGNFRIAEDSLGFWHGANTHLGPCELGFGTVHFNVNLRPHPLYTTGGSGFTLTGPTTYIFTPNPWGVMPDFIMDVVAYFATPYTNDVSLSTSCE
jgi:hypothetical protein